MRLYLALAALLPVLSLPAHGQYASVVQMCTRDFAKHCAQDGASKGANFAACINAHFEAFSAGCKTALGKVAMVTSSCSDDIAKQCAAIRPGSGRILLCVRKHYPALSDACKAAIGQAAVDHLQARSAN
jgi:hypothetical protein